MEIYRGHEINCRAERATLGKPSARWCCSLSIRQLDEPQPTCYEAAVTTWTIISARMLCLDFAKEYIDDALGALRLGQSPTGEGDREDASNVWQVAHTEPATIVLHELLGDGQA